MQKLGTNPALQVLAKVLTSIINIPLFIFSFPLIGLSFIFTKLTDLFDALGGTGI